MFQTTNQMRYRDIDHNNSLVWKKYANDLAVPSSSPNPNQHSNDLAVRSLSFRSLQKLSGKMYKTVRLDRNHHASFTDATSHYQWNIMKPKSSFMNFALSSVKKVAFPPVPRIQRWAWGGRRESPKKWKCRSSAAISWLQTGADRLLGKSPWAIQSWIHRARPSPRQQQAGLMPDPFVTIGLQNWGFKWGLSAWNLAAISAPYSYVGHFVFRLGASMDPQIRSYLRIEAYLPSGIQTWRRRIPYRWESIAGKIIYGRLSIAIATLNPFAGSNLMLIRPIPSCSMLFHNLKLNLFPIIIQYPP